MESLSSHCRPFIKDFDRFTEICSDWANFHDTKLLSIDFKDADNSGRHGYCLFKVGFSLDDFIVLKFTNVHSIFTDIHDFRSSFFFSIDFRVTDWCDYGKCICMETDGDCVRIIAEYLEVVD